MKYEILEENSFYHIYNCGNNKENLFIEYQNYNYFLQLLKKHIKSTCSILAYCLLKNHFHLLVKTKPNVESRRISQSFSNFFNAYSKSINKKYNRSGSLFKDRFSRIKIRNEEYLKNLIVYIHLNPKHHELINDFRKYYFSSYNSYFSNKYTNLDRGYVVDLFDGLENFKYYHEQKQLKIIDKLILE